MFSRHQQKSIHTEEWEYLLFLLRPVETGRGRRGTQWNLYKLIWEMSWKTPKFVSREQLMWQKYQLVFNQQFLSIIEVLVIGKNTRRKTEMTVANLLLSADVPETYHNICLALLVLYNRLGTDLLACKLRNAVFYY